MIRFGTAGWTDPTLTAPGVFYPDDARTAERRLRYYASRFPLVEIDSTYYALPAERSASLWATRTPRGFVFDVKANALMTGHATETSRLPKSLRDVLPPELASKRRISASSLPDELRDEVWRTFLSALEPLHQSGKLGSVLLQFPPWFGPSRRNADAIVDAVRRLDDAGVDVDDLSLRRPTLDDVFLTLTGHAAEEAPVDADNGIPVAAGRTS